MNIHLLESERFSKKAFSWLTELGRVTMGNGAEDLAQCDVLFVRLARRIDQDFVTQHCPNVKYVLSPTTGHDHLDADFFEKSEIKLISLRGEVDFLSTVPSTAEHTWALLLALLRKIPIAVQHASQPIWNRDLFIGNNLYGKNLGILGLGRVGKQVANFALAFGMKIHAYDILDLPFFKEIKLYRSFQEFASSIDILSVHIPMDESNRNWLNATRIAMLKQQSWIVNTSRGGVWDETAVADALREGRLAGVATDVLADELYPNRMANSPLIRASKEGLPLIITPHIAGACIESMNMTEEFVVQKLMDLIHD